MDEVRIEDLPDGGIYQGSDRFPLQRQESGVWNDFQTNFDQYFGEVVMEVFPVTWGSGMAESISAGGQLLILLNAVAIVEAQTGASNFSPQIAFSQGSNPTLGLIEVLDADAGSGAPLSWLNDPTSTPDTYLDQSIDINSSAGPFTGVGSVIVWYALVDPV